MSTTAPSEAFTKARSEIYAAHDLDPTKTTPRGSNDSNSIPYETHYAQRMEHFLSQRSPDASEILRLAVSAQHFRRWEVPRSSYPMTKLGYHSWRTYLKKRQAELVGEIVGKYYSAEETSRCRALIEKEGLKQGEDEVQVLEDVACLVFLDDQFDEFREKHDEGKIVGILRKTWGKMSGRGQEMALELSMTDECRELVTKALQSS